MSRLKKLLLFSALAITALVVLVVVAGVLTLRSDWFHDKVRDRIIAEVQEGSGGRAEIGRFRFDWETMTARVEPFTLHGKEKAGEETFLRMDSIEVGLKIVSAFRRDVDIATLIVERPRLNIIVYPDGTTNIPSPAVKKNGKNLVQRVIDLAVGRLELREGLFTFRDEKRPFDIRCDNLRAGLDYVSLGRFYQGRLQSQQFRFNSPHVGPLAFDFDTDVKLYGNSIEFPRTRLMAGNSHVDASGILRDITAPKGEFDVRATASLAEMGKALRLPIEHRGTGNFEGKITFALGNTFDYRINGRTEGQGLAYSDRRVQLRGVRVNSAVEITPEGLTASGVRLNSPSGSFSGSFTMPQFRSFRLDGQAGGVSLAEAAGIQKTTLPWSGTASGPVSVSGALGESGPRNVAVRGDLAIAPAPGGIPVEGNVKFAYSQASGLTLGDTHLFTPATRVEVSGTPGGVLHVILRSTDLHDLQPALDMAGANMQMPVQLNNGSTTADVNVSGPLNNPRVEGRVGMNSFEWENRRFDTLTGDVDVTRSGIEVRNAVVVQGPMQVTGAGHVELSNWRVSDASAVSASFNVAGADIKKMLVDAGQKDIPVSGIASASGQISGTYGALNGEAQVTTSRFEAYGEQFDSAQATVRLAGAVVVVPSAQLRVGQSRVDIEGTYAHRPGDWKSGELRIAANTKGLPISAFQHVHAFRDDITANLAFNSSIHALLTNGDFDIDSLQAQANLQTISLDNTRFGNVQLSAVTKAQTLDVNVTGNLRDSKIQGHGEWQLTGEYPGRGEVTFSPLRLATVKALLTKAAGTPADLPFRGVVEGSMQVSGPLKSPDKLQWAATLPRVQVTPTAEQPIRAGANLQDLTLANVRPVVVRGTMSSLTVESAEFTARNTKLEVLGTVAFNDKSPWNIAVRGGINLAILQLFNPDLVGRGNAVVNASLKGALRDPQLSGELQFKDASLYLGDLPVGVDHAEGLVKFDRNRATIQKLTAEVGGGKVAMGGFVGFSRGLLLYRVQATAEEVRVRYPEGVSTTLNCGLNLTGTSESSLVSGTVTVMRVGFTPKADIGAMIATTASNPISAPETPSEFLRRVQLDVRVESGPSMLFTTSLARDIEAEAELRLRGTAARPSLIGTISVTEGEIQLFGNKYEINRGEVRFLNPTRIEPFFDADLQTRARGVDVTISFSGTLNKLNMTYRSDPPLQSSEIIALLAMGRDPTAMAGLASAQVASQSLLQSGSGIIGQAISSPVTNRLQRFFGVSRLKIDPQLTGVENIPEARLTLEQQISRDITLTYITNIARTNEQIVRLQWDINRRWSAIATRQENGSFGVDFQYRKRFK